MTKAYKIIIYLNLISALWLSYVLLFIARFSALDWLIVYPAAFLQCLLIIALLTNRKILISICCVLLLLFGVGSLLTFGWGLIQINHIVIIISTAYIIGHQMANRHTKSLIIGILAAVLIFMLFLEYQKNYLKTHPELKQKTDKNIKIKSPKK